MYYYSLNIMNYLFSFLFFSVWWQCQLPQSCQRWKPGKGPGVSQGQYRHQYLQRCKIYSSFFSTIHTCQTSIKMNRADRYIYPYFLTISWHPTMNESGFMTPVHLLWHIFSKFFLVNIFFQTLVKIKFVYVFFGGLSDLVKILALNSTQKYQILLDRDHFDRLICM